MCQELSKVNHMQNLEFYGGQSVYPHFTEEKNWSLK